MTPMVDICWPLHGRHIPLRHQYPLLAAISRLIPDVHHSIEYGIHPIRGIRCEAGVLKLTAGSEVRIRCRAEKISQLLSLNGKKLDLANCPVRLGIAQIHTLQVAPDLYCHLATIKGYVDAAKFSTGVRRQLDTMSISSSVIVKVGPRRVLNVRQRVIVGFQLVLAGLEGSESVLIQERGIGGRRRLGCGLFNAVTRAEWSEEGRLAWQKQ